MHIDSAPPARTRLRAQDLRLLLKRGLRFLRSFVRSRVDESSAKAVDLPAVGGEALLRLVDAYIALVDLDAKRSFGALHERFAYEAGIVLHHANRRCRPDAAEVILEQYARRKYGRKAAALLKEFRQEPLRDIQRLAMNDLAQFVIRRHRARRRQG